MRRGNFTLKKFFIIKLGILPRAYLEPLISLNLEITYNVKSGACLGRPNPKPGRPEPNVGRGAELSFPLLSAFFLV